MEDKKIKKQFPIKFKKNEREDILEFANMQTNFNDTIRYLIEKEIAENGIRNLQEFIPPVRDKSYFSKENSTSNEKVTSDKITFNLQEDTKKIPKCYE